MTVPVRRRGILALVVPIPPATITFHARATVHASGSFDVGSVSKELESILPDDRQATSCVLELVPEGRFVTYGIGVSLMAMRTRMSRSPTCRSHRSYSRSGAGSTAPWRGRPNRDEPADRRPDARPAAPPHGLGERRAVRPARSGSPTRPSRSVARQRVDGRADRRAPRTAANRYAARLEGVARPEGVAPPPTTAAEVAELATRCAAYDARIRAQAALPDGVAGYSDPGSEARARSTIVGQAIHHATEHRAQIAGALATNGLDVIDLDALDVWAYGEAEGLGA